MEVSRVGTLDSSVAKLAALAVVCFISRFDE